MIISTAGPSNANRPTAGRDGNKLPRSLVISPNLDALLEHEDRTQRQNASVSWSPGPATSVSSPQSGSFSGSFSLPPPPRGPRHTRPPTSPSFTSSPLKQQFLGSDGGSPMSTRDAPGFASSPGSPVVVSGPTTPNPYINPAPSLTEVLRLDHGLAGVTITPPPRTSSMTVDSLPQIREDSDTPLMNGGNSSPQLRTDGSLKDSPTRPIDDASPRSPADSRRARNDFSSKQQSQLSQLSHRKQLSSLPRVDKLLSKVGLGTTQKTENEEVSNISPPPRETNTLESSQKLMRNKNRGKLLKIKEIQKQSG